MKVLLELLGDASRVLGNVEGLSDFRPESRDRVRDLLKQLRLEADRVLEAEAAKPEEQDDREIFLHRSLEAISAGDHDVARGILEDAVSMFPDDFEFLNYLGLVAWEQGDLRAAEMGYHRAVQAVFGDELDVDCVDGDGDPALRAVEGRALALYRLGRLDKALEYFQWLGRHFSGEYVGCRYLAGEVLHLRGDIEEAIEWYERVPVEPAVLYNLGLAYYENNQLDKAAYTLIRAFVANIHIATLLLDRYSSQKACTPGYLGSRAYAEEFVDACVRLWHGAAGSVDFLERCFDHGLVRSHLDRCGERGGSRLLQAGDGAMKCGGWLDQLQDESTLQNMSEQILRRFRI